MATQVVKDEQELNLDAIESDARQRIAELTEQHARLALDSLSDERLAAEVADIESEVVVAEAELRRVAVARIEAERREREARERAEAEARAGTLAEAKELDAALLASARKFDAAADQLARSAQEHRNTAEQRQRLLHRAGVAQHPWTGVTGIYAAALIAAFSESVLVGEFAAELNGRPERLEDTSDQLTA
jgi:hypothetical protein